MAKANKLPTTSSMPAAVPAPKSDKGYEERERKYRAEDALRDIERAEGHKGDKSLMKDVKQLAKAKIKSLGKIK